ncbi:DUF4913 domain-containing protein [Kineococcus glutinatus]|uniref:DUF4913 domain-containing protein n=1 Tax=Kineococcus glutinatus TaxID=1070872 RepID=A0ABP9HEC3_9ACTN
MSASEEVLPDYRLEELEARTARLELRVDELDAFFPTPSTGAIGGEDDETVVYPDLASWVSGFFAPTFARAVGGEARWCARWAEHREAVYRLQALWRAWEALRTDARTGHALWLRDHLDPQLAVLLSARGPFAQCTATRHEALLALPSASPGG